MQSTKTVLNYARSKNYDVSDPTYFYSLAWGGLTTDTNGNETDIFKAMIPDQDTRNAIKNTILIEQTGKDMNGNTVLQLGNKGGC